MADREIANLRADLARLSERLVLTDEEREWRQRLQARVEELEEKHATQDE